ncbi:similar to Saccharomyces cerevisiae YFR016C Putative protein of unknown function [Maudiozyma saulgeensis]|uniref:Uncharacterized protein n=1 Tax=Maudiozyma saulgeensis TaxID=1789683 RepID=A0A1X7R1W7_9SACH|nr:similar to Saccharomyces cerevisiae YFR016C Putative protein of unknown function [Kazachstania saulgeensis]
MIDAAQSLTNDLTTHTTKKKRNRRKKKKKNAQKNTTVDATDNSTETTQSKKDKLDSILVGIEEYLQTNSDENEDVPVNIISNQNIDAKPKKVEVNEEDNVPNESTQLDKPKVDDTTLMKNTYEDNLINGETAGDITKEKEIEESEENEISKPDESREQTIQETPDDDKSVKESCLTRVTPTKNEIESKIDDDIDNVDELSEAKDGNEKIALNVADELNISTEADSDKIETNAEPVAVDAKEENKTEDDDRNAIDTHAIASNEEVKNATCDKPSEDQPADEIPVNSSGPQIEPVFIKEVSEKPKDIVETDVENKSPPTTSNNIKGIENDTPDDLLHHTTSSLLSERIETEGTDITDALREKKNDTINDTTLFEKPDVINVDVSENEPEDTKVGYIMDSPDEEIIVNVERAPEIPDPEDMNERKEKNLQSPTESTNGEVSKSVNLDDDKQPSTSTKEDTAKETEIEEEPLSEENCLVIDDNKSKVEEKEEKEEDVSIVKTDNDSSTVTEKDESSEQEVTTLDETKGKAPEEISPGDQQDQLHNDTLTDMKTDETVGVPKNDTDNTIEIDSPNKDNNTVIKEGEATINTEKKEEIIQGGKMEIPTTNSDKTDDLTESRSKTTEENIKDIDNTSSEEVVDPHIIIDNTKTEDNDTETVNHAIEEVVDDPNVITDVLGKDSTVEDIEETSEKKNTDTILIDDADSTSTDEVNVSQPPTENDTTEVDKVNDDLMVDQTTELNVADDEDGKIETSEAAAEEEAHVESESISQDTIQEKNVEIEEMETNTETLAQDTVEGLDLGPIEETPGLDNVTEEPVNQDENNNTDSNVNMISGKNSLDDILAETDAFLKELDFVDDSELNSLLESLEPNKKKTTTSVNDNNDNNTIKKSDIRKLYENEPVYIYTSLAGGGFHMIPRTNRLATILQANQVKFTYRDLGTDDAARKVWKTHSRGRTLPGVVRGANDIIGNWEEIDDLNEDYRVREAIFETL